MSLAGATGLVTYQRSLDRLRYHTVCQSRYSHSCRTAFTALHASMQAGHGRSPRHAVAVLSRGSSRDLDAQSSTYSEAESTLGGGGGDGAGGKSGSGKDNTAVSRIVAPYHYDASTIFRARDPAKEAPVPKAEVYLPSPKSGITLRHRWEERVVFCSLIEDECKRPVVY